MFRRAWALRAAGGRGQARWRSDDGVTIESRIVLGSASLIPFPLGSPLSSFFFPFFWDRVFLPGERLLKTTWQADREERREVFLFILQYSEW